MTSTVSKNIKIMCMNCFKKPAKIKKKNKMQEVACVNKYFNIGYLYLFALEMTLQGLESCHKLTCI